MPTWCVLFVCCAFCLCVHVRTETCTNAFLTPVGSQQLSMQIQGQHLSRIGTTVRVGIFFLMFFLRGGIHRKVNVAANSFARQALAGGTQPKEAGKSFHAARIES